MRAPGLKQKVKAAAVLAGMNSYELASVLGISRVTLWRRLDNPDTLSRFELRKLHQYLKLDWEDLMA